MGFRTQKPKAFGREDGSVTTRETSDENPIGSPQSDRRGSAGSNSHPAAPSRPRPSIAGIRPHGTTRRNESASPSVLSSRQSSRPDSSGHVSAVVTSRHTRVTKARAGHPNSDPDGTIDARSHGRSVRHHGWTNQTANALVPAIAIVAGEVVCAHTTASCRLTLPSSCSARVWVGHRHATSSRGSSWHLARAR